MCWENSTQIPAGETNRILLQKRSPPLSTCSGKCFCKAETSCTSRREGHERTEDYNTYREGKTLFREALAV